MKKSSNDLYFFHDKPQYIYTIYGFRYNGFHYKPYSGIVLGNFFKNEALKHATR